MASTDRLGRSRAVRFRHTRLDDEFMNGSRELVAEFDSQGYHFEQAVAF